MELFYLNHKNQKLDFMNGNYEVEESSFFSHEWEYDSQSLSRFGERITQLKKRTQKRKLVIHITNQGLVSCEKAFNDLFDVVEADSFDMIPGRLFLDGSYLSCFVVMSEPKYFVPGIGSISCELSLITPYPFWITEQRIEIKPISNMAAVAEEAGLKQYPYNYPYRYPILQTETTYDIDHYTDSHFQMIIYGPTIGVHVNIAGHPYIVDYELKAGEYMVIDSRPYVDKEKRLYVVRVNGDTESIFDYRSAEFSVFQKIPPGRIKIDYSRTYGVDLIIFKERSEPPWKL